MTETVREILALEERIVQAERVFDPGFFDDIIDDGFSFAAQDGTVFGKAQVLAAHQPAGGTKFSRYETSGLNIRDFGDAAVVTVGVDLSASGTDVSLLFTRFWLKRDERWRIIGGSALQLEHSH